ncbi:MAG: PilZ domain-containing protein [Defluviitaleaceae bacterium]|nr:PilZ domain-containing protein [Defluviitaleaceae bacterium]
MENKEEENNKEYEQRRNFYRIYRQLPIQFEFADVEDPERQHGVTQNISASGMLFDHDYFLDINSNIKISIEIEETTIQAVATVIDRIELPKSAKNKYRYRINFKKISPRYQDFIVEYVWKQQLDESKNQFYAKYGDGLKNS